MAYTTISIMTGKGGSFLAMWQTMVALSTRLIIIHVLSSCNILIQLWTKLHQRFAFKCFHLIEHHKLSFPADPIDLK